MTTAQGSKAAHDMFDILSAGDVDVVGTALDVSDQELASLWRLLSPHEQERANRLRLTIERARFIVARGRLRILLAERLHVAPEAVDLIATGHGKPMLGPAHAGSAIAFNLSHSGSLAVYAIGPRRAIGVDIEEVREIPDADQLADQLFSDKEAASLRAIAPDMRNLAFLACWTRKEAFVKAIGEGLSHPLDTFDVTVEPEGPARISHVGSGGSQGWSLESFRPREGYIGAVVYSEPS
jgi:4'-phosphopantetheinyl transferase